MKMKTSQLIAAARVGALVFTSVQAKQVPIPISAERNWI